VTLSRHPGRLELVDDSGERLPTGVVLDAGEGQGRRLDDDRDRSAAGDEMLERRPREGIAERFGDGGTDGGEWLEGWRRREQSGVVVDGHEENA
jgi:hypothetical protein